MIPKKIHYCWFGKSDIGDEARAYIDGWEKLHPDYEIKEWNEDNFDVDSIRYVKEAYEKKKYAFVSDYARLYALYNEGGIYLDTDVELLRNIDKFRKFRAFLGYECKDFIGTAIIGAEKELPEIRQMMDMYADRSFVLENESIDTSTNVNLLTHYLEGLGLHRDGIKTKVGNFAIFNQIYFYPNTIGMIFDHKPQKSYAIHHIFASWNDGGGRRRDLVGNTVHYVGGKARNILGTEKYARLRGIDKL